jgi:hypothetical protein
MNPFDCLPGLLFAAPGLLVVAGSLYIRRKIKTALARRQRVRDGKGRVIEHTRLGRLGEANLPGHVAFIAGIGSGAAPP